MNHRMTDRLPADLWELASETYDQAWMNGADQLDSLRVALLALDAKGFLLTDERRQQLLGDPAALVGWAPEQRARNEAFNANLRFEEDVEHSHG